MAMTTITVPVEVLDELKRRAAAHGRSVADELEALLRTACRDERLRAMRYAMTVNPPDEEYQREAHIWLGPSWV